MLQKTKFKSVSNNIKYNHGLQWMLAIARPTEPSRYA